MTENTLRNQLIRVASENQEARDAILGLIKEHDAAVSAELSDLSASISENYTGLDDTLFHLAGDAIDTDGITKEAADQRRVVTKMVGMTKQRIQQAVDAYSDAEKELAAAEAEYKDVLAKLKKLKSVKDAALKPLKEAASQLQEKGQIALMGREQCLNMTVFIQDKTPGIMQMMAEEDDEALKKGQKAGELYARFVAEMGEESARTAMAVVQQCKADLQHTASVVRSIKLVAKAGDAAGVAKSAGVLEVAQQAFQWIHGQVSRMVGIAGDITKWAKGFVTRTKAARKAVDLQGKTFKSAQSKLESALK